MSSTDNHVHTCPSCGHTADVDEFVAGDAGSAADSAGVLQCPECGELDWGDD